MTTTTQTQDLANEFGNFYQVTQSYLGIRFNSASALGVGAKLNSFRMSVKRTNSPSGDLKCRLYPVSPASLDDYKEQSSTTYDATDDIDTSFTNKTFNFNGLSTIANGDFLVLFYNGGDGSNYLTAEYQDTDVYDSTNTIYIRENGGDLTTADAKFQLVYTESTPPSSSSLLNPPQVAYI